MAIATSTKLIGKNIVLLDGTKTKITDAMATGYKVADRSVRVASKQVAKKGACYYEIPVTSLRELIDSGEGYVSFADKAMQKKVGTDAFLEKPAKTSGRKPKEEKSSGRKPKEEKTSNVRPKRGSKPTKEEDDAEDKASRRVKRRGNSDAGYGALAEFLINGGNSKKKVSLAAIDQDLATVLTERLVSTVKETSLAKFDGNNAMIQNAFDVGYSTEFDATGGDVRVTLNIKYALEQPEPEEVNGGFEISPELAKKIKARVGKTVGKKLAAAIAEHLGVEASDMTAGTLLSREGEDGQFVFCGASGEDNNKAVLFNTESEKFRTVGGASLANYSIVEEDEEEEESEEEEEEEIEEEETEEEEDDAEGEDDSEDGDDDSEDGDDDAEGEDDEEDSFEYASVNKKQLANVNKKITSKNLPMLSKLWRVPQSALVTGLKLTDGDDTFIFIGMDDDGDLLVVEEGAKEVVAFDADDIQSLSDYSPVVGEAEDDAEGEDEDFEDDGEDYDDMDIEELRDVVVQKGLAKVRAAENMTEKKLRSLLK
ncbi:hypothetical protein HOU08_gp301 [Dickeya phage vB_DsoM_JA29]|uniref:Uncharacterized protein n=1 Tax=Dickeya phage vB_DsoM_JA29 TaxID=2283031 RepID=A0A384ZXS0_9CAUD|nr:hypothetical protein HOU08_gp301 [Dickeya phage vB_DsoM_JA29]AXG67027.1 hypothetical protein JA29_301 [Dickeya phage vB_DsoM_JA29]